jgi:type VI secretion system protein
MPCPPAGKRGFLWRWGSLALLLWAVVGLAGCGAKVSTRSFTLAATPEANDRSAIAVDVVLVRDEALLGILGALSARTWFDEKAQLALDHPRGFEIVHWELVPGQRLEIRNPFRTRKGHAIYVFANYLTPGAHRVRVDAFERFTLVLDRDGFALSGER